jgi:hypothetical protein
MWLAEYLTTVQHTQRMITDWLFIGVNSLSHLLFYNIGQVFHYTAEAPHCQCLALQADDKPIDGGINCLALHDQHSNSCTTGCLDKAVSYA